MTKVVETIIPVITIDGPGGSGKGTIGQLLAKALGWHYLDSGALYRVLAVAAEHQKLKLDDESGLAYLATHLDAKFDTTHNVGLPPRIMLEGKDVTEAIRTEAFGNLASQVSALPAVRQALLERQREFRKRPGLVTDGRDMGSVVFPDAILKIFLMASPQERAQRRYLQLKQKGINVSLDALCSELMLRDERDRDRTVAPLKPAEGAVLIDTSGLGIQEVLQCVQEEVNKVLHNG